MRFKDKVCIVTGGGSGIGQATCLRLAAEGGKVVVMDLKGDRAGETVQKIQAAKGEAVASAGDVSDSKAVRAAIDLAVSKWGKVDVVVNDAAMMTFDRIVDLAEDAWDKVLAVNLKSVFLFAKYAIPKMPKGGAIVNISSVHAHQTEAGVGPYAASKGGMEALCRVLSLECLDRGVRINCVAPGAVNTPMLWNNPNVKSGKERPEGDIGQPADIAAVVAFLASDEAKFVNGTTVVADGSKLDSL
jgi:glucose 1-dehydrogenase